MKENLKKMKEINKELTEINEEEQLALAEFKKKKRIDLCVKELNELLEKHQCRLAVDPNSPLVNLKILVTDRE